MFSALAFLYLTAGVAVFLRLREQGPVTTEPRGVAEPGREPLVPLGFERAEQIIVMGAPGDGIGHVVRYLEKIGARTGRLAGALAPSAPLSGASFAGHKEPLHARRDVLEASEALVATDAALSERQRGLVGERVNFFTKYIHTYSSTVLVLRGSASPT
jgi:hypothetical protein